MRQVRRCQRTVVQDQRSRQAQRWWMGPTRSMYVDILFAYFWFMLLSTLLQSTEKPTLSSFLPPLPVVDISFVTKSSAFIWLTKPEVPSSTPPASRSMLAAARPELPAPTNLSDSLVPTRILTPVSSSTPSATLPTSSLVLLFLSSLPRLPPTRRLTPTTMLIHPLPSPPALTRMILPPPLPLPPVLMRIILPLSRLPLSRLLLSQVKALILLPSRAQALIHPRTTTLALPLPLALTRTTPPLSQVQVLIRPRTILEPATPRRELPMMILFPPSPLLSMNISLVTSLV